ncbi:non-homologous end-joining DNA ligase [Nocardiopsis coralliicola]
MGDPLERVPPDQRSLLRAAPLPEHPGAMLATRAPRAFSGSGWIFERKLDGERVLAVRRGGRARLVSRNGKDLTATYPEVAVGVEGDGAQDSPDLVADGEVVAFSGGRTSFARLQQRMGLTDPEEALAAGVAVHYYVFDLLSYDGCDLTRLPQRTRKQVVRAALEWVEPLRYTPHRNAAGEQAYADACRSGWEGVIAKRSDAPYRPGRGRDWLKLPCVAGQEFVIGGFTPPQGSRIGFGALLIGYYADGALRYAGKVGTGYSDRTLRALRTRLDGIARTSSPFADPVGERGAHWVRPELVAEVRFTEWTGDGRLRHPAYLGLRDDKAPADVVREPPGPGG